MDFLFRAIFNTIFQGILHQGYFSSSPERGTLIGVTWVTCGCLVQVVCPGNQTMWPGAPSAGISTLSEHDLPHLLIGTAWGAMFIERFGGSGYLAGTIEQGICWFFFLLLNLGRGWTSGQTWKELRRKWYSQGKARLPLGQVQRDGGSVWKKIKDKEKYCFS